MIISSSQAVQALLETADLVLTPDVGNRGTLDFSGMSEIVDAGESETREREAELAALALSDADYERHQAGEVTAHRSVYGQRRDRRHRHSRLGAGRRADRSARHRDRCRRCPRLRAVAARPRARLRARRLRNGRLRHRASEWTSVNLVIDAREKTGGPFFLRSALNLDVDEDQERDLGIPRQRHGDPPQSARSRMADRREDRQPAAPGDRAVSTSRPRKVGGSSRRGCVSAQGPARCLHGRAVHRRDRSDDRGRTVRSGGWLSAGSARYASERIASSGEQSVVTGADLGELPSVDLGGVRASLVFDRLDSVYFPRKGQLGVISVALSRPALGADDAYEAGIFSHVGVTSVGRHTWLSWIDVGTRNWRGPAFVRLLRRRRPVLVLGLRAWRALRRQLRNRSADLSLSSRFAAARLWARGSTSVPGSKQGTTGRVGDAASLDDLLYAATVALGAETVVGPIYLALGVAEGGRSQITLSLGPSFSARPR